MVVTVARTGLVGAEARARGIPLQTDLVVRLAWFAGAIGQHAQQLLDQLSAAHADALAKSVETQWRIRDAARAELGRLSGALAEARAEIERLTATVAHPESQVAPPKAALAEAPAPHAPHDPAGIARQR